MLGVFAGSLSSIFGVEHPRCMTQMLTNLVCGVLSCGLSSALIDDTNGLVARYLSSSYVS